MVAEVKLDDVALAHAAVASARSLPAGAWLSVNISAELAEQPSELADILAFLHDAGRPLEVRFRLEDLAKCFLPRLRRELEQADIVPGRETPRIEDTSRGAG